MKARHLPEIPTCPVNTLTPGMDVHLKEPLTKSAMSRIANEIMIIARSATKAIAIMIATPGSAIQ